MPIVILRDKDGQRVLPIWVGMFEANAIALQIENISTPRPMTHDLLRNVINDLKATVQKIVVCDLKDSTFYALIYLAAERRDWWPSTPGRATPSRWRCGRGRRSSWRRRSSTTRSPSTSPPDKPDTDRLQKWLESLDPGRPRHTRCRLARPPVSRLHNPATIAHARVTRSR